MSDTFELAVFSANGVSAVPLPQGREIVVGRGEDADIALDDAGVSRRHAVFRGGPPVEVEDLGSANGILVSRSARGRGDKTADQTRERVTRTTLAPGDSVFIGAALVVLRVVARPKGELHEIVKDPAMVRLYEEAARAAQLTLPIRITGETGSGKEVLAHYIHRRSPRAKQPFVALNCAAVAESLAESELFGHERGAFTGAQQARAGVFEAAHGGTLFLDEVGELSLAVQAKLLRALESGQIARVGSVKPVTVDVRVVTATNRNLEREAASGRFRQDLFFRLNGIVIAIPPLRARQAEIGELAAFFLDAASRKAGLASPPTLGPEALAALTSYGWPGNVRELRYAMERVLVARTSGTVTVSDLPPEIHAPRSAPGAPASATEAATRERVIEALAQADGNQTRAAEILGVSRRTLINRIIEFDLPRPRKP